MNRQIHRVLLETRNTEYRNKLEHKDLGGTGVYEHGRGSCMKPSAGYIHGLRRDRMTTTTTTTTTSLAILHI
jgi:hypothetical protein